MPEITSRQHPIVRAFRTAARGEAGVMLLDGWHLLQDAADAGVEIATIAVAEVPPDDAPRALLDRLARNSEIVTVSRAVLEALSPVRTPTGVVALARAPHRALPDVLTPPPALVLVAVDIQDPGNAGAIVRSAEAGGASGVVLTGASADPWGWKALRAAMGSTFRLPVMRQLDATTVCDELRRAGLTLRAAVPRGGTAIGEADLRLPSALIVGAEGAGLTDDLLSLVDEQVTIPMRPPVESLNVAVAAALLVYEARRQRWPGSGG